MYVVLLFGVCVLTYNDFTRKGAPKPGALLYIREAVTFHVSYMRVHIKINSD